MNSEQLVLYLERQWDDGGFLDAVRGGVFDREAASGFIESLRKVSIEEDLVPKRLVSLLWYMPLFLNWQAERVTEISDVSSSSYRQFVTAVENVLEDVIGVP